MLLTQRIPNIHYVQPINDQWWIGASATSNYGLATEFNDGYTEGGFSGKTDLLTGNFNLSTAYRLNDNLSFGVGFDAVYAKAKIERYAGEAGAVAHLKGDKWGYGWNAGILYEVDKNNRFGFTYRSKVKIDFDGDYKSSIPAAFNGTPQALTLGLPFGTSGNTIPSSLTLNLPEM